MYLYNSLYIYIYIVPRPHPRASRLAPLSFLPQPRPHPCTFPHEASFRSSACPVTPFRETLAVFRFHFGPSDVQSVYAPFDSWTPKEIQLGAGGEAKSRSKIPVEGNLYIV